MRHSVKTKLQTTFIYGVSVFCISASGTVLAQSAARQQQPPPALASHAGKAAQKDPTDQDIDPTAALFDAINKGNTNAAKEALNRGADINAHNILDQTPMDMAIDLNRFDIAFLFLALRTYSGEGSTQIATTTLPSEQGSTNSRGKVTGRQKGHGRAVIQTSIDHNHSRSYSSKNLPSQPYSHENGGVAQPNVGFLGFGN